MGNIVLACALAGIVLGAGTARAESGIAYSVGSWPEELGNHRACITVSSGSGAVWTHIPWRRRDASPQDKAVIITDSAGKRIANAVPIDVNREYGDIVFEPASGPGQYYAYYMPFTHNNILWQWTTVYTPPQDTADPGWRSTNGLAEDRLASGGWRKLPKADVTGFQARSEFHRFDPMELIATRDEMSALLAAHPQHMLIFPEDRRYPIRMTDDLPQRWIEKGPSLEFAGDACRNEYYTFQIGFFAATEPVDGVQVTFGGLKNPQGKLIRASAFKCFNLGGTDWLGKSFTKTVSVGQGKVQALWCGVQIPKAAVVGHYTGRLTVRCKGANPVDVKLDINVLPRVLNDCGDSEIWRFSRLRWLDSKIGLDDEVVAPYTPLKVKGRSVSCLLRDVRFAKTGLPESIRSKGNEILAEPMRMVVQTKAGRITLKPGEIRVLKSAPGMVLMESNWSGGGLTAKCLSKMEADGYTNFGVSLRAKKPLDVTDIRLEIPFKREIARYMIGIGFKGGYRPATWDSSWDPRHGNSLWMGDVDAGMYIKLKGPTDTWILTDEPRDPAPDAWKNDGKGGWRVREQDETVLLTAYTGERSLAAGQEVMLRFATLITPVKPLDPNHWKNRYYQFWTKVESPDFAAQKGATVVNIHQGNEYNPYINYPFLTADKLSDYVSDAHSKGLKVEIYHTVRILSNFAPEIWPLRSLGGEIFTDGNHEGDTWLKEHLITDYSSHWHQPYPNGEVDAAITTTGLSRWHNYYLQGLSWLMKNVGIDGLYLDGIGYDREIMKRVRKIMDRAKPGCLMDLHSGNLFKAGITGVAPMKSSVVNHYMEHFPYITSLWIGENFQYNEEPADYWLVEISGIPFGLPSDMLQMPVNPWRGMVFGMSSRYWSGANPKPMWEFWDRFGTEDATMIGWWDRKCPVKTDHKDVMATAYVKKGKTLISIASWETKPVRAKLNIDWKAIGLDPAKCVLSAPAISEFQSETQFSPTDSIPVEPTKGWLLIVQPR